MEKKPIATTLSIEEMMPAVCEALSEGYSVELSLSGSSMLPLVREGRDTVILTRLTRPIRKYDVVLYRRQDSSYVLHRAVHIGGETFSAVGDNQLIVERGIPHSAVIAKLDFVRREGKLIDPNSFMRRRCAELRNFTRPMRHFLVRVKRKLKRMFAKRR